MKRDIHMTRDLYIRKCCDRIDVQSSSCIAAVHTDSHVMEIIHVDLRMGWLRLVGSLKNRALLRNIVSFIGLLCKRDL